MCHFFTYVQPFIIQKLFSPSLRKICITSSSSLCGRNFIFLHISLYLSVSELPIKTMLTKFSYSNYIRLYSVPSQILASYSSMRLQTFSTSKFFCLNVPEYSYTWFLLSDIYLSNPSHL